MCLVFKSELAQAHAEKAEDDPPNARGGSPVRPCMVPHSSKLGKLSKRKNPATQISPRPSLLAQRKSHYNRCYSDFRKKNKRK